MIIIVPKAIRYAKIANIAGFFSFKVFDYTRNKIFNLFLNRITIKRLYCILVKSFKDISAPVCTLGITFDLSYG